MKIYIDFEKKLIEKIEDEKLIYSGSNNVDIIRLIFTNTNGAVFYPTLSAMLSNGRMIMPRLYDNSEDNSYDFTLSTANGWLLTPGNTDFFIWINYNEKKNDCAGNFTCNILKTGGYYCIDSPRLNPEIQKLIYETLGYMGPRGVVKNYSELYTFYPNGAEGIYVNLEDGKWYYWNEENSEWQEGYHYQATGLPKITINDVENLQDTLDVINDRIDDEVEQLHNLHDTDKSYLEQKIDDVNDKLTSGNEKVYFKEIYENGLRIATQEDIAVINEAHDDDIDRLENNKADKTWVEQLIGNLSGVSLRKVNTLPSTGEANVIYLVNENLGINENIYNEYIYIDNKWELIGNTAIDIDNFVTKDDLGDIETILDRLNGEV